MLQINHCPHIMEMEERFLCNHLPLSGSQVYITREWAVAVTMSVFVREGSYWWDSGLSPALQPGSRFCYLEKNADLYDKMNDLAHFVLLQGFSALGAFADHPHETQIFLDSGQKLRGPFKNVFPNFYFYSSIYFIFFLNVWLSYQRNYS